MSERKTLQLRRKHRRLYSNKKPTSAKNLVPLLREGYDIEVTEDGQDVTQESLFAVLANLQYHGQPLITVAELTQILRRDPITGELPK